jgi:succinate dehydrogenase / fumarate reductase cytochrome b subunit
MNWFIEFSNSSIGRKIRVAATGLLLCGYLVIHLFGNLFVFGGHDVYNHYAEVMESNPVLPAIELALLAVFAYHIAGALYSTYLNRKARPVGYQVSRSAGGQTLSGKAMVLSGITLLAFLVVHVRAFRFLRGEDLFGFETSTLACKPLAAFYLLALAALFPHLNHGFQSAFNTLGANHPKFNCQVKVVSALFAGAIVAGFASCVVYVAFVLGGGS